MVSKVPQNILERGQKKVQKKRRESKYGYREVDG